MTVTIERDAGKGLAARAATEYVPTRVGARSAKHGAIVNTCGSQGWFVLPDGHGDFLIGVKRRRCDHQRDSLQKGLDDGTGLLLDH